MGQLTAQSVISKGKQSLELAYLKYRIGYLIQLKEVYQELDKSCIFDQDVPEPDGRIISIYFGVIVCTFLKRACIHHPLPMEVKTTTLVNCYLIEKGIVRKNSYYICFSEILIYLKHSSNVSVCGHMSSGNFPFTELIHSLNYSNPSSPPENQP